jgi:pimeloyl-ACP methyl ester carboxylesterase
VISVISVVKPFGHPPGVQVVYLERLQKGTCAVNDTSRPPLIYFPGLDGTGRLLHRQPGLDAAFDVRCLCYPHDRLCTYEELAALGEKELRQPGVVLAESFGGAAALTLALKQPELVQRLVLVNTFAYFPKRVRLRLAALAGRFFPTRPSHPATRGVRGWFFFAPEISPAERKEWWDRTAGVPMRAFGYRIQMIAGLDMRSQLSSIRTPTLILAAPNDRTVHPAGGRELARLLPCARLLEPRVGHAALIHPEVNVAQLLADAALWPARTEATAVAASRPG